MSEVLLGQSQSSTQRSQLDGILETATDWARVEMRLFGFLRVFRLGPGDLAASEGGEDGGDDPGSRSSED